MRNDRTEYIYKGIIAIGFLLPLVIAAVVVLAIDPTELLRLFLSSVISFVLIGAFNAIPFLVYAKMWKAYWQRPDKDTLDAEVLRQKYGLFFAAMLGLSVIIYYQIHTWIGIVKVAPGSSTSGIAFMLLPIYGLLSIVVGYGLGFAFAKLQDLRKSRI